MARRQLPRRGRAGARDPRGSAARVLPPAAQARRGPARGLSARLGLAWAFVAHTDSRFDPETLRRFVRAFQRVQPLTIGELWAVAIALRIVLVENLRRLAERIVRGRAARQEADALADELLGLGGTARSTRSRFQRLEAAALAPAFAVAARAAAARPGSRATPALALARRAARRAQGTTPDEIVRVEHQRQAAMNVTVRNVITSMRLMSALDWAEFFESVSLVDEVLRAGTALRRPWTSRPATATVTRSRSSRAAPARSELEVTRLAMAAAKRAAAAAPRTGAPPGGRAEDPGYYLISRRARRVLEEDDRLPRPAERAGCCAPTLAGATPGYLAHHRRSSPAVAPGAAAADRARVRHEPSAPWSCSALLARHPGLRPRGRARQSRGHGGARPDGRCRAWSCATACPPSLRTLVVVPTLLTERGRRSRSRSDGWRSTTSPIRTATSASPSSRTGRDAPTETHAGGRSAPGGRRATASRGSTRATARAPGGGARFLLLHRRRLWNAGEGTWMGWERKRGKLDELNRLLRGRDATRRSCAPRARRRRARGRPLRDHPRRRHPSAPRRRDRLVGTMAHPLNRPRFDPATRPRRRGLRRPPAAGHAHACPPSAAGRSSSGSSPGPPGSTPTPPRSPTSTRTSSARARTPARASTTWTRSARPSTGRVPENALLSHDLFEGIFARAGTRDRHRAVRGVPHRLRGRGRPPAPLGARRLAAPAVDRQGRRRRRGARRRPPAHRRWKMLDNLRRTLSAPAAWLTLVAGWTLPGTLGRWCGPRSCWPPSRSPLSCPRSPRSSPRRSGISKRTHIRAVGTELRARVRPDRPRHHLPRPPGVADGRRDRADARPPVRDPPAAARVDDRGAGQVRTWPSTSPASTGACAAPVILAVAAGALVALAAPGARRDRRAVPPGLGALPLVARWVSRPPRPSPTPDRSPSRSAQILRSTARRTWRFFETFVGPDDHSLPPDNFQEDPKPVVAHRTSPTNIGLYLLVVGRRARLRLARHPRHARPSGGDPRHDAPPRALPGPLLQLVRHRRDLRPLEPRYVSTVDSGNLAGHLLDPRQRLPRARSTPRCWIPTGFGGLRDAVRPRRGSRERARGRPAHPDRHPRSSRRDLRGPDRGAPASPPADPAEWSGPRPSPGPPRRHPRGHRRAALTAERGDPVDSDVLVWAEAARATIAGHERDLQTLLPWASAPRGRVGRRSAALRALRSSRAHSRRSSGPLPGRDRRAHDPARDGGPRGPRAGRRPSRDSTRPSTAFGGRPRPPSRSSGASRRSRAPRGELAAEMEFGFLFDPARKIFSIGYRVADGSLDPSALRPARVRGAARQLHRDRQGRRAGLALVPPRPAADPGRHRVGAPLLVGLDVRVPDAGARHALPGRAACWRRPTASWSAAR